MCVWDDGCDVEGHSTLGKGHLVSWNGGWEYSLFCHAGTTVSLVWDHMDEQ